MVIASEVVPHSLDPQKLCPSRARALGDFNPHPTILRRENSCLPIFFIYQCYADFDMDIKAILEAKKREIEAKLLAKNGQSGQPAFDSTSSIPVPPIPPTPINIPPVPPSALEQDISQISESMEQLIHNLARDVARDGPLLEEQRRRETGSEQYEFLSRPQSAAYLLYQQRLGELRQIQLLASRKRPAEFEPSQSGVVEGAQSTLRKRSSRWGPQPPTEVLSAPIAVLNEEQASELELIHLRQQLAERNMSLAAKAGVAEIQLGLGIPSAEHRMRALEMEKTKEKAKILTKMGEGKHHMQDFLPKEELLKFIKPRDGSLPVATPVAQYEDNKLTETNVGYQMLKKFGWSEGKGLGAGGSGISAPVSSVTPLERAGLGTKKPDEPSAEDDEFSLYRKRMMTAYKYRPNPLNNPRRPYY
ncbi:putative SURP and G-patch domain-containing protein 1 [Hypsibius exemplaris]|uniref:SURP and G-patch domain-containing protein 1 n=1 Tax=Hypsibius exemplaris TaxID=2072580 RepID=A0A1W0W8I4_HYPEX|nr:putative SURP and G-patch domain-containing protein 1 [Hypsibius exemplaris]